MSWKIIQSDCLAFLAGLDPKSVDLVLCSPPYEKARLYLEDDEDLGIAMDTEEWVAWMVKVVRASLRICRGLCAFVVEGQTHDFRYSCGPMLLMADLCRQGICLRKPVAFTRSGIPGSGGPDWLRNDWEPVICCTNGGKLPWSDNTAMGHKPKYDIGGKMTHRTKGGERVNFGHRRDGVVKGGHDRNICDIANPGNVLALKVGGGHMGEGDAFAAQGEAPYPEELCEFFIRSFCPPGGTVVDMFSGTGTTAAVAVRWGRHFIGCDLRQSQVDIANKRLETETPLALYS